MTHSQPCCSDSKSRSLHDQKYASFVFMILGLSICLPRVSFCQTDHAAGAGPKPFIEYFRPIPISSKLSKEAWGAATVGPRDPSNGLEDTAMKQWDYWDGKIFRGSDGKYRMFASRWEQAKGHDGWFASKAVRAVSTPRWGPTVTRGCAGRIIKVARATM